MEIRGTNRARRGAGNIYGSETGLGTGLPRSEPSGQPHRGQEKWLKKARSPRFLVVSGIIILTGVIALCLDLLVFENQAEVTRSSQANGLAELGVIYIGTKLEQKRVGLPPAQGLLVTEVKAGGPAEQAGLRPGDLITAINGKPLEPTDSLLAVLANNRPGDRVVLTVVRQNETLKLEVTLSELR